MSRRGVNSWTRTAMGRIWIPPAERRTPYVFSGGLKVTPNVLPASCRQTVACRIVPFCRQDAGSTLNRHRNPVRPGAHWVSVPADREIGAPADLISRLGGGI